MLWLAYAALLIPLGVVCFLALGLVLAEPGDAVRRPCSWRWRRRWHSRSVSR